MANGPTGVRHRAIGVSVLALTLSIIPAAGRAQCVATASQRVASTSATVIAGQAFAFRFGDRYALNLTPVPFGWIIEVREDGREENLARLTPPWHFVPNPRFVEGWHFRNAANTGPNEGSVNAPQEIRDFIFSPEVGRTLEYEGSATPAAVVEEVRRFGRGRLVIRDYTLTPPSEGERAAFQEMTFDVCLVWRLGG